MKQLLGGVVLIILLGIAGFFYRNAIERPGMPEMGCTLEAKLCPDGQSVGRSGPACAFAPCPAPNVEDKEKGITFALPAGYVYSVDRSAYEKKSLSASVMHTLTIAQIPVREGQTAEEVIVANTIFYPADIPAESIDQFTKKDIAGRLYYVVVVERFEGLVNSYYYLPRATDVLRFEILEHDVTEWTNPDLVIEEVPEHRGLRKMLETIQL